MNAERREVLEGLLQEVDDRAFWLGLEVKTAEFERDRLLEANARQFVTIEELKVERDALTRRARRLEGIVRDLAELVGPPNALRAVTQKG